MSDFAVAYERMIRNEGGYVLHQVAGDRGGQTYAGIARNFHSQWPGWQLIDKGQLDDPQLTALVREFYQQGFWNRIRGDEIGKQSIADSIFDFAVNAGVRTASKLAQLVVEATPDGHIGPITLDKLNQSQEEVFVLKYALAKVARYAQISQRDPGQRKFLLGWINRTLEGLS